MEFTVSNEKELGDEVWRHIKPKVKPGFKCALVGDLGAGKTSLVKEIAQKLKIKAHITSPTFNIRKEYAIDDTSFLQHIDLYRHNTNLADMAEVNEWLNDLAAISFVEWPERASNDLSVYDVVIELDFLGENNRKVTIKWN